MKKNAMCKKYEAAHLSLPRYTIKNVPLTLIVLHCSIQFPVLCSRYASVFAQKRIFF